MMWTGELCLAQQDGALPTPLAAGGAPGESGVSVLRVRFRDVAHSSGTTQQHLICLVSEVRIECHMAGRALRYEAPAGSLITSSAPQRASPRPYLREAGGEIPPAYSPALLRQNPEEQVHGQEEDASQAPCSKAEGNPRRDEAPHACSATGTASVATSSAERSLSVLRSDLQLSITARVQGMRRQGLAKCARQT
jgi:hypothetical protein